MQKQMAKLRLVAQSIPMTFESWILSFTAILLIRMLIEQFSSFQAGRFPLIDLPTILHYGAFFLASSIAIMVILIYFGKVGLKEAMGISILGLPIICLPPIVDLITGGVGGHIMSYILVPGKDLLELFITYFSLPHMVNPVTLGIKIEGIIGIIFFYFYVYNATKSIKRGLMAALSFYCFLFLLASTPSLVALFMHNVGSVNPIVQSIAGSNVLSNNLNPNFSANSTALLDLGFNKMMLGVSVLVAFLGALLLFFLGAKEKFMAMLKNIRGERIFYFFLLFTLGNALAHTRLFNNWLDVQAYLLAIIALISAAIVSICQNDIYDESIDEVSNPNRPLIVQKLSREDMQTISKIFLLFALLAAYASSMYVLFFTTLMMLVYFIYSNPPLRLKRFVFVNSTLVSIACVSAVMEGFFLINTDKSAIAFPFGLLLSILFFHTAVSNIRDIKDYEGDKASGIKTLPVLVGLENSKKLIAGVICIFYLAIPWYFHSYFLVIPSIIATILSWYFITQKDYVEWKGFAVYMTYLLLIIGTIIFI